MGLFESFKKGIDNAKRDVYSPDKKTDKLDLLKMKEIIFDKNINDAEVALKLKSFLASSLSAVDNDDVTNLFIKERPEAVDKLLNK